MSLKLNTASGGSITLQEADTASNLTITVPATTATMAIDGPAFSAYNTSNQSVTSSTLTKITFQTEVFDTNNNFASSTFTPTVAGYYQINGLLRAVGTAITSSFVAIYKNGSIYSYASVLDGVSATSSQLVASEVIYMNGSTDYLELYGFIVATSPAFGYVTTGINCRFSGSMVRGA
jgi:hypothetical protein